VGEVPVGVKVCGLSEAGHIARAAAGGARYIGFVFYPPSPRSLDPEHAGRLARSAPRGPLKVGVFVDPSDAELERVLAAVPLDVLQLHGDETPERVAEIGRRTDLRTMKAIRVAEADDLAPLPGYAEVADLVLFDAKPPRDPGTLPGGNGLAFDWRLLRNIRLDRPWLLAGGLHAGNLEEAVRLTAAPCVDVSSGVETEPGAKDPDLIDRFLEIAAHIGAPAARRQ
jgi:phosphoribosylanthranilate isomerase